MRQLNKVLMYLSLPSQIVPPYCITTLVYKFLEYMTKANALTIHIDRLEGFDSGRSPVLSLNCKWKPDIYINWT